MPFRLVLGDLLAQNRGALAAVFVDDEGETVDLACAEAPSPLDPAQVRVTGAYLGIFLRRAHGTFSSLAIGAPRLVHVERGGLHLYAIALPEGYLLALIQRRPALSGRARASLAAAADRLRRELFAL